MDNTPAEGPIYLPVDIHSSEWLCIKAQPATSGGCHNPGWDISSPHYGVSLSIRAVLCLGPLDSMEIKGPENNAALSRVQRRSSTTY